MNSQFLFVDLPRALALAASLLLATTCPTFAGQTVYEYDNLNRLVKTIFADGSHTRYEYDNDGNRKIQITVAKPTVKVVVSPSPMLLDNLANVSWITTGALSLTLTCSAAGTGYRITNEPITPVAIGSFEPFYPNPAWAGYPSTCLWTAVGPGGTGIFEHPLTTLPKPTILVSVQPDPMRVGSDARVTWSTSHATTVSYSCTASGTGYATPSVPVTPAAGGTLGPFRPEPTWVGYPSQCTWRATSAGGITTYTHALTTLAAQRR